MIDMLIAAVTADHHFKWWLDMNPYKGFWNVTACAAIALFSRSL